MCLGAFVVKANTETLALKSKGEMQETVDCSVVVPLYNESSVVKELYERLTKTMVGSGLEYELVFVEDGSEDNTLELLKQTCANDERVTVVELRRNFGQTPALAAGFDTARGRIIISMDGDLQHAPEEIPSFLEKINEGYDVVSGWRMRRVDNLVMRKIPSRAANWIASKISGVDIHDFGTTFKAYRREVIEQLRLYGEMHRFIPALLSQSGVRIIEIPITNIVRPSGASNYGIGRTLRVAFDLITLRFLLGYITRPLHFFGRSALFCIAASFLMAAYMLFDKLYYKVPIFVAHAPLALLTAVLILVGAIFVATGLIGEMVSRVYFESTDRKIYAVRRIHRRNRPSAHGPRATDYGARPSAHGPRATSHRSRVTGPGLIILLVAAAAVGLVRHFHIRNFHVVDARFLYTSGQPRGMSYTRLLYKYHIATIVNVRSAAEHRERNWYNEELTWVRANGVMYYELPIDRDINSSGYFPEKPTQKRFLEIMQDKTNLPVLLHGSSGRGRVAMLTAVWLIRGKALTAEEAIKIAERIKQETLVERETTFIKRLAQP